MVQVLFVLLMVNVKASLLWGFIQKYVPLCPIWVFVVMLILSLVKVWGWFLVQALPTVTVPLLLDPIRISLLSWTLHV